MNTREPAMESRHSSMRGDGVHHFLGRRVEAAVVDAEAESSIVFLREQYAGVVGWLDPAIAGALVQ